MQIISRGKILDLSIPRIMGIVNVTPDSFSDGGKYYKISKAIDHVSKMIRDGADIIDVGGESTRPGSEEISDEEEAERVIPVIKEISKRFDVFISVDTYKALVVRESINVGVHLINDIYSLSRTDTLSVILENMENILICLVHMNGNPKTMQVSPSYKNVLLEVKDFFSEKIKYLRSLGVKKNKLIIDPGFGFGKSLEHNYLLLAQLGKLRSFKLPILVGTSRKSMIGELTKLPPDKRTVGSISCAVISAMKGANIIRVHDVKETKEALSIVKYLLSIKKTIKNDQ